MAADNTTSIRANFSTREASERAVERLVQVHGINRADVFVQATGSKNTAGTEPSGADAANESASGSAFRPALEGPIEVSVDIPADGAGEVEQTFRSLGADDVTVK